MRDDIPEMTLIVNGEKIDDSLIQREMELLRPQYEQTFKDMGPKEREAQLIEWSKENIIERVLVNQSAKSHGGDIAESEIEAVLEKMADQNGGTEELAKNFDVEGTQKIKEAIELQMRVERLLQDVCKDIPEPSEEAVLQFYNENKEQFETVEQIRAAHIVKHVDGHTNETTAREIMGKVQEELNKGQTFEALVSKYSDCPDNGGDLGYITSGQMVEEFDDVVFNLGTGEVSEIFHTRFGVHIAKVYDRKAPIVQQLKEVEGPIIDELKGQMQETVIENFIDNLKDNAVIEEI